MIIASEKPTVLYSQICVFDPALEAPYNEWTDAHNRQGFSWREGSVSFATSFDGGEIELVIELVKSLERDESALCIIKVPFSVPDTGHVECGSIMSGLVTQIEPGEYCLMYSDFGKERGVNLSFAKGACRPEVMKEYGAISVPDIYVMEARSG